MLAAGPEYSCLSNWKTQITGSRNVVCAKFSSLLPWYEESLAEGETATVKDVVNLFSEIPEEAVQAYVDEGIHMFKGTVAAGETLRLLAGWLFLEKALNSEPVTGVRFLETPARADPCFMSLAQMVCPGTPKPGSTTAFMHKIMLATQACVKGKGKGKADGSTAGPPVIPKAKLAAVAAAAVAAKTEQS